MAGLSGAGAKNTMMGLGQTQRNSKRMMRARLIPTFVLLAALAATNAGCRTDSGNIQAWGSKSQGPRKLVAVLTHEKYPTELRIEAALMLVSMKPRGGRRIGIQGTDEQPGLIDALAQMQPASRTAIVARLVPKLQEEMLKPLPATVGHTSGNPRMSRSISSWRTTR